MPTAGILTTHNDLHALAVQQRIESRGRVQCRVIEGSRIAGNPGLNWFAGPGLPSTATLPARDDELVEPSDFSAIWCRRANTDQERVAELSNATHADLVNRDSHAAVLGVLCSSFHGAWISDPMATRLAENKLVQLQAAQAAGFRIPRTLVSQDPPQIREFCRAMSSGAVIKPVRGTNLFHLFTREVTADHLADDDTLAISPAIYQELVVGRSHLRVHCFGSQVFAVRIDSEALDWRQNLEIPFSPYDLREEVRIRLLRVLSALNLRMGVFDLKLDEHGEVTWLEVNPQGQFLFSEGLSGVDLTDAFVGFLERETLMAAFRAPRRSVEAR